MLSTTRPSPLRLAGFLCGIGGAAVMALGALMTWATIGLRAQPGQPPNDSLTSPIKGIDIWEGIAVLVAALLVIGLIMATRFVTGARTPRTLAILAAVIAIAAVVVAGLTLARADSRFKEDGSQTLASEISKQTGLPEAQVADRIAAKYASLVEIQTGAGLPTAVAGGVVAVVGCILVAAWTTRRDLVGGLERPVEAEEVAGASSDPSAPSAGDPGS